MSTFSFNKLFILESLPVSELQTGTELKKRINQWTSTKGINCQAVTYQVHSLQDWEIAWNGIYTSIEKMGNVPIIHLEMHGNKTAIGIDGGVNGIISLNEVFQKVQHANVLSQNNVFLSLAVCMGLNVIRSLKVYEPMPFCGVLGSLETLKNDELLENYTIFYKAFLSTLNLDMAEQFMKKAGIDASKYEIYKPEQVFINAYLGYLETYKTDEQINEKAIGAAKSAGIVFHGDEEKNRFVRDYRCTLLLTENKEYIRAINVFFMFDRFPSISSHFEVPKDIFDFKQFAAKDGHKWLLQKRRLNDDDIKGLAIQILNNVDVFCKDNGIRYSLAYGTLLGAVRHKGFIPWDDDIDILMLREDYNKFIASYNRDDSQLFSVASYETDPCIPFPFAKIVCNNTLKNELGFSRYGHAIDLFPIDKIPESVKQHSRLIKRQLFFWNLFQMKVMKWDNKRSIIKKVEFFLFKPIAWLLPYNLLHKWIRKGPQSYSTLQTGFLLGNLFSPYGKREIMQKNVFLDYIQLPFENYSYSCLKNYDSYLTSIYKDYMKLPPMEQRVTHHDFTVFWK